MIAVTIVWAIYFSVHFFASLPVGIFVWIPVPLGPIVAVLSREEIMRLTEQIDELQR